MASKSPGQLWETGSGIHRGEQCDIVSVFQKFLSLTQLVNNSLSQFSCFFFLMWGLRSLLGHSEEMLKLRLSAPHLGCEKRVSISSHWILYLLVLTLVYNKYKIKLNCSVLWTTRINNTFLKFIETFRWKLSNKDKYFLSL